MVDGYFCDDKRSGVAAQAGSVRSQVVLFQNNYKCILFHTPDFLKLDFVN